jgi:hypothetical protein
VLRFREVALGRNVLVRHGHVRRERRDVVSLLARPRGTSLAVWRRRLLPAQRG